MCVHVIPCECVFEFVDVFLYGEGYAQFELKAFRCGSNKMQTHGKACVSQLEGVHMWFE